MSLSDPTPGSAADRLAVLVDELLDAHCDTVCLAHEQSDDVAWAAHLDYLRALQRVGRSTLAELTDVAPARRTAPAPSAPAPSTVR